ncbi:9998_t:CDS:2, partial [Dentiscutata heterogama]
LGLDIEDERPYDPMEINLAILNTAKRIGGNPTMNIVNTSRTVRKKKPPIRKRVIKKVVGPKNKQVNLVTYEEATEDPNNEEEEVYEEIVYEDKDNENVEYVEVEDSPKETLCNNSTIAMNLLEQKVSKICKKIFQNELRNILNKFKTLLSSYNLSPELASSIALDEPMDINLVHRPANDLTIAECRINNILIPKAVLDGARCLGLKIDTTNPPSLEGVATNASSYGWCYN